MKESDYIHASDQARLRAARLIIGSVLIPPGLVTEFRTLAKTFDAILAGFDAKLAIEDDDA